MIVPVQHIANDTKLDVQHPYKLPLKTKIGNFFRKIWNWGRDKLTKVPIIGGAISNIAEAHIRKPEDYVNGKYDKKLAMENDKKNGINKAGWLGDTTN